MYEEIDLTGISKFCKKQHPLIFLPISFPYIVYFKNFFFMHIYNNLPYLGIDILLILSSITSVIK